MKSAAKKSAELATQQFKRPADWEKWLAKHHAASPGLWLKLAKKDSEIQSINYAEALDVALCYGWIDGQKKGFDDSFWLQKFTPRGRKSIWSKINRAKALAFIKSGQMQPAGLRAVELAKKDGRWEAAYDSHTTSVVPADFQDALDHNPAAGAFFTTLNSGNRYAVLFRIQTVKKAETRARRIKQFIEMLARHEKVHP